MTDSPVTTGPPPTSGGPRTSWPDVVKAMIPDTRTVISFAMLGMTLYILWLVANFPDLSKSDLFKMLATLLVGSSGVGMALGFYFGSSKDRSPPPSA